MKIYPAEETRGADICTFKVWHDGDSVLVGLRSTGYGYYFKGYWHGSHKDVRDAFHAWMQRPVVGNQGVVADTSEPLSLDDLDMAMF